MIKIRSGCPLQYTSHSLGISPQKMFKKVHAGLTLKLGFLFCYMKICCVDSSISTLEDKSKSVIMTKPETQSPLKHFSVIKR